MQKNKINIRMPRPKHIVSEALEENYEEVPKNVMAKLDKSKKMKTSIFYPHHVK
jgi:hypothetical protein